MKKTRVVAGLAAASASLAAGAAVANATGGAWGVWVPVALMAVGLAVLAGLVYKAGSVALVAGLVVGCVCIATIPLLARLSGQEWRPWPPVVLGGLLVGALLLTVLGVITGARPPTSDPDPRPRPRRRRRTRRR